MRFIAKLQMTDSVGEHQLEAVSHLEAHRKAIKLAKRVKNCLHLIRVEKCPEGLPAGKAAR